MTAISTDERLDELRYDLAEYQQACEYHETRAGHLERELIDLRAEIAVVIKERGLAEQDKFERGNTIDRLRAEVERLRRVKAEAEISLKAIGEPEPHDPPDARICAVIARSCLVRIAALKGSTNDR